MREQKINSKNSPDAEVQKTPVRNYVPNKEKSLSESSGSSLCEYSSEYGETLTEKSRLGTEKNSQSKYSSGQGEVFSEKSLEGSEKGSKNKSRQKKGGAFSEKSWVKSGITIAGKLSWVVRAMGDVVLPRHCAVCGEILTADEKFLCSDCADDFPLTYYWDMAYNPAADRLNENIQRILESPTETNGGPLPKTGKENRMEECQDERGEISEEGRIAASRYEPYARFAALFFYNEDNGYRHICHRLKYQGDIGLGREYARRLGSRLADSPLFNDVDMVTPVPLHWARRLKRGYNQAEIIAEEVAAQLGARHCPHLLRRNKHTVTQTVLSVEEKKKNVAGAFEVQRGKEWHPRHILIIDDVLTTGATIAECHKALRDAFPHPVRISAATLSCVEKI